MITVTAMNMDDLRRQVDGLSAKDVRETTKDDHRRDHMMRIAGMAALPKTPAEALGLLPSASHMMFVGNLDDFDGRVYRVSEDGKASFRVYDPEEPHGSIKIEVDKPPLRQQLKALGLTLGNQRIRVTIEVLP
jgi:hypothetical protein